jgi:outer membrane receptor for Fe3+-dicitrate
MGLRWDSYSFLVKDNAFSPRVGMGWQAPKIDATFYASYDRVFATPAIENLLVSSSAVAQSLTDSATGLPVHPARGDYYQLGVRKLWTGKLMANANYFVRDVRNFFDDDLLLNTGVSFPISFARARIRGWETKIETRTTGRFSASVSYSNQVGVGILPITGGLLLEDGAQELLHSTTRFPISQDQRNTLHTSARYRLLKQSWISSDTYYGSGLPIEVDSASLADLSARSSNEILSKVNLEKGRVRPSASVDIAAGTTLWSHNDRFIQLQASAENIFDRVNVINFAGVLSGTAIGAPRHYGVRLRFSF